MPVLTCARAFGGTTSSRNEQGVREHTLQWIVTTNEKDISGPALLQQAASASPNPAPTIFTSYADDLPARCVDLQAKQRSDAPLIWDIEAKFSTDQQTADQQSENPQLRPSAYSVELSQFQYVLQKDINGKPICNSLQRPFLPAPEQEDSRPVLVVQKNIETLGEVIGMMINYKDSVNSRPFYGAKRRQAKMKSITSGTQQFENGFPYYPVTFRIEFKGENETWDVEIMDTAMLFYPPDLANVYSLPGPNEKLTNRIDGKEVTEPQIITPAGRLIPRDSATGKLLKDPFYLKFRTFPERDFGHLGI